LHLFVLYSCKRLRIDIAEIIKSQSPLFPQSANGRSKSLLFSKTSLLYSATEIRVTFMQNYIRSRLVFTKFQRTSIVRHGELVEFWTYIVSSRRKRLKRNNHGVEIASPERQRPRPHIRNPADESVLAVLRLAERWRKGSERLHVFRIPCRRMSCAMLWPYTPLPPPLLRPSTPSTQLRGAADSQFLNSCYRPVYSGYPLPQLTPSLPA